MYSQSHWQHHACKESEMSNPTCKGCLRGILLCSNKQSRLSLISKKCLEQYQFWEGMLLSYKLLGKMCIVALKLRRFLLPFFCSAFWLWLQFQILKLWRNICKEMSTMIGTNSNSDSASWRSAVASDAYRENISVLWILETAAVSNRCCQSLN